MAVKEKPLRRLTEKLNAAGIVWAVGAGCMLTLNGITDSYHDFDLYTRPEDIEKADKVLTRLGMRSPMETEAAFACGYHFDGAEIHLYAAPVFGGQAMRFDESSVAGTATVLGVPVPLMYPEDWLVYYTLLGKTPRAELVADWLRSHECHAERFAACIEGEVPAAVSNLMNDKGGDPV